jgi:uncharacterized membrane protein
MSADNLRQTEAILGYVLTAGTRASTACLAAGLILTFAVPGARITGILLTIGMLVLMATPLTRVLVSIAAFARQHDWKFVLLASTVLALLLASVGVALR